VHLPKYCIVANTSAIDLGRCKAFNHSSIAISNALKPDSTYRKTTMLY
jgi:hypothetical protein